MAKNICKVCGTAYSYCPDCVRDLDKPRWMISFDKQECKDLFDALVQNSSGKMSNEDALKKVNEFKHEIKNKSVLGHVAKLKSGPSNEDIRPEPVIKTEVVKTPPSSSLFHTDTKEDSLVKESTSTAPSIFNNNTSFSSNMKNTGRAKEAAESIGSAINELNRKDEMKLVD